MWGDWDIYAAAVRVFLAGGNPYWVTNFYNPIWALPFFVPFALLGEPLGQICYTLVSLGAFAYAALRVSSNRYVAFAFLVSMPVFGATITMVNLDWLPLLALFTPAPLAVVLAMTKPQIGIVFVLFLSYRAYREKRLILTLVPLAVLSVLTAALYGIPHFTEPTTSPWKVSIFPYAVPLGIALLGAAFRWNKPALTIPASLAIAPYFGQTSFAALIFPILHDKRLMITLTVVLWAWKIATEWR